MLVQAKDEAGAELRRKTDSVSRNLSRAPFPRTQPGVHPGAAAGRWHGAGGQAGKRQQPQCSASPISLLPSVTLLPSPDPPASPSALLGDSSILLSLSPLPSSNGKISSWTEHQGARVDVVCPFQERAHLYESAGAREELCHPGPPWQACLECSPHRTARFLFASPEIGDFSL